MVDNLYGEGASLLQAAGNQATANAQTRQAGTETTVKAGEAAGAQLGDTQRQQQAQQAAQALEVMKQKFDTVEITPQLALGLVRNTGDREWMKSIGQRMRADVYTSLYTHGINMKMMKPYKVGFGKDMELTIQPSMDENGNWSYTPVGDPVHKFSDTARGVITPEKQAELDLKNKALETKERLAQYKLTAPTAKSTATALKDFTSRYQAMQVQLTSKERNLAFNPDDADLKKEITAMRYEIQDKASAYDEALAKMAQAGGVGPAGSGLGGQGTPAPVGGGGADPMAAINDIWNKASAGQAPSPDQATPEGAEVSP